MRLHHGVALQRGSVSQVKLDRSRSEGAREITHRAIGLNRASVNPGSARPIEIVAQHVFTGRLIIADAHQVGGCPSLLEGFGHHKRDRLAVIRHLRTGEHRMGLMVITRALRGRASMREHQKHAGRFIGRARINRFDAPFADRRFENIAVSRRWSLQHLICIAGAPGDLQPSVHTIKRLADNALRDIQRIRSDG